MTTPGGVSLAGLAAQINAELADPTGSRPLSFTVPTGDLGSDPAGLEALRRGAEGLMARLPPAAG